MFVFHCRPPRSKLPVSFFTGLEVFAVLMQISRQRKKVIKSEREVRCPCGFIPGFWWLIVMKLRSVLGLRLDDDETVSLPPD